MDIKMIASDVDGTLLPYGGSTPEVTLRTLEELYQKGVELVLASGRVLSAFPVDIIKLPGRYVISSNGAVITDRVEGKRIYEALIPAHEAAQILEKLKKYETYTCVYIGDQAYNWSDIPEFVEKYYPKRDLFRQNPKRDLVEFVQNCSGNVEKIFVVAGNPEEKARIRREQRGIPGIQLTSSSAMNIEINHEDADKGRAVAWLGERLGIRVENILAMGDNENDHTMLKLAGYSIAPENAKEETKELVDRVVGKCQDGGAAHFLRELFFL